jgi:hypothetical protein
MNKFILFVLLIFLSDKLSGNPLIEKNLSENLYDIFAVIGDKKILIAEKVEFDIGKKDIYYIHKENKLIEHRKNAWQWIKDKNENILQINIASGSNLKIKFSDQTDKQLIGVLINPQEINLGELTSHLPTETQLNISFEKIENQKKEEQQKKISGEWSFLHEIDEFYLADEEILSDIKIEFNDAQKLLLKFNDNKIKDVLSIDFSPLQKYFWLTNPKTNSKKLYYLHSTYDENLFLTTSGTNNEVKNFQLSKITDRWIYERGFYFFHQKGANIPVKEHQSYNMRQEVIREKNGFVYVKRTNKKLPQKIEGAYPLASSPFALKDVYLSSGKYVDSDNPEIKALTERIMKGTNFTNQHELVKHVLRQCARLLKYGNSELISSASEALKLGVANCIGYTHLHAAVLRNLGIPTRNLRVYNTSPSQITKISKSESAGTFVLNESEEYHIPWVPHYVLEVYYPSLNDWISIDPQTRDLDFVGLNSVLLYETPDWDMDKHRQTRPLATDPNLLILGGNIRRSQNHEWEMPIITKVDPEIVKLKPEAILNIYTKQPSDQISNVYYRFITGTLVPLVKDDRDDRKWSLYLSTLEQLPRFYPDEKGNFDLIEDGIIVQDIFGSTLYYQWSHNSDEAKSQYPFDLYHLKSLLSNSKIIDKETNELVYAFCGDEIHLIKNEQKTITPDSKYNYKIRLNSRRGMFIDIISKQGTSTLHSLRVSSPDEGKTIKLGEKEFNLLKESYCH